MTLTVFEPDTITNLDESLPCMRNGCGTEMVWWGYAHDPCDGATTRGPY